MMNDEKTKKFIQKSQAKFGNKFDYTKTIYKTSKTKLCIICKEHGEFWVTPSNHLKSNGCPICVKNTFRKSLATFINECNIVHNHKYDYSKVEYKNNKEKICIVCPYHGEFWQQPILHLKGEGCPKCKNETIKRKLRMSTQDFINKSKSIHNNDFSYEKTNLNERYNNKIIVTCNKCKKDIYVVVGAHLSGNKCPHCYGTHLKTTDEFIQDAKKVHGDKYDYSKVKYKGNKIKICIICPKHGEFWQTPNCHLRQRGCPKCKNSYLEQKIDNFLQKEHIIFESQKHFEWLGKQSLDFYLPQYNIAIECQGEQHFNAIEKFGGEDGLKKRQQLDEQKYNLCEEHNIHILYYSNKKYAENIITTQQQLIQKIKNI